MEYLDKKVKWECLDFLETPVKKEMPDYLALTEDLARKAIVVFPEFLVALEERENEAYLE